MVQIDSDAATHVLARLPLHALTGTKSQAVAHLRRMSVDSLAAWSPEVLLDYVLCRAMDERLYFPRRMVAAALAHNLWLRVPPELRKRSGVR